LALVPEQTLSFERADARIVYRVRRAPNTQTRGGLKPPPVLFLHGLASNMGRWAELARETTLTRSHDLIRVDLRGHGESQTRRYFDLSVWCADLLELMRREQVNQAILIGHSLGAQLAMAFATRYPQKLAGLALIDPIFREAVLPEKRSFVRNGPVYQVAAHALRLINRLGLHRGDLPLMDLEGMDQQARAALARIPPHIKPQDSPEFQAFVSKYSSTKLDLKHIPHANYFQDMVEMFRPLPSLKLIDCSVLVLRSTVASYQDEAIVKQRLSELKRLTLKPIHCHHWPVTEKPVEVREVLEQWVNDLDYSKTMS
jgi:esterase